eukprot:GHVU01226126.1.p1 GENE.GHVU01226126.1~~GHVU01226126.1.p1  ORF type:complete len:385 (+),score=64.22 GHVU01226126.1:711-1865(+)
MESRVSRRRQQYRKVWDDARPKREHQQEQIRKQIRDENLAKRRYMQNENTDPAVPGGAESAGAADPIGDQAVPAQFGQDQVMHFMQNLLSPDPQIRVESTQHFRKILSVESNPPIDAVIAAGAVPYFVEFLKCSDFKDLQFEAAWCLTNIASGTNQQTQTVVSHGAVPLLVQLLRSPYADIQEQAIWAIGNIAGDCVQLRDLVLNSDALRPLLDLPLDSSKLGLMRNATWTISNLCRGKPPPNFAAVKGCLPVVAKLMKSNDSEVLADACWTLSYVSDGENEQIQDVINSGVCERVVELMNHRNLMVQTPALRTIGNIVTGNDEQTQTPIRFGCLRCLHGLLRHPKKAIRKEACWTISNVTAGGWGGRDWTTARLVGDARLAAD